MALIKCPACNANISDSAPACVKCGHPMKTQTASIAPQPSCQPQPIQPVLPAVAPVVSEPDMDFLPVKSKTPMIVGLVIGVVIVIAAIVFFVMRSATSGSSGQNVTSGGSSSSSNSFIDSRDGQKYRFVNIGSQTWMAENLNYQTGKSWCYDNNGSNCQKYGRLYDWNTAMKACPVGWKLPTRQDWENLAKATGGKRMEDEDIGSYWSRTENLKSTTGWSDNGNGMDKIGFSALPGGRRWYGGSDDFAHIGITGYWWSSTHTSDEYADYWGINSDKHYYDDITDNATSNGYSVRCVQVNTGGNSKAIPESTLLVDGIVAAANIKHYSTTKKGFVLVDEEDPLNLRSCPQAEDFCEILMALERGTALTVLGESGDGRWYKVRYNGITAYARSKFISDKEI